MKRLYAAFMFGTICAILLALAACIPYSYQMRPLDRSHLQGMRTALVMITSLETSWAGGNPAWLDCKFNLSFASTPENEMKQWMSEYVHPLEEKTWKDLYQHMANTAFKTFTAEGMPNIGLDKRAVFYSHDFPITIPGEQYRWGAVYRDFISLKTKGYTHALIIGFNNTMEFAKDKRMLYFGIKAILYNIQEPTTADVPAEQRDKRATWRYYIIQSPVQKTRGSTSWYERDGLQIECEFDERSCTVEELFTGSNPLYLTIFKRAGGVNLGHAANHFARRPVGETKIAVPIGKFLKLTKE